MASEDGAAQMLPEQKAQAQLAAGNFDAVAPMLDELELQVSYDCCQCCPRCCICISRVTSQQPIVPAESCPGGAGPAMARGSSHAGPHLQRSPVSAALTQHTICLLQSTQQWPCLQVRCTIPVEAIRRPCQAGLLLAPVLSLLLPFSCLIRPSLSAEPCCPAGP